MGQHRIYLNDEQEKVIQDAARKLKIKPSEALKIQLEKGLQSNQLGRVERKLDALFLLLEAVLPELGHGVGAITAVSEKIPGAPAQANLVRSSFELAIRRVKAEFLERET